MKKYLKQALRRSISSILAFLTVISLMPVFAWQSLAEGLETVAQRFTLSSENDSLHFDDVPEGTWYYDYVKYAYENGLFSGATATSFEPEGAMMRGMFVTVLGNGLALVDKQQYQSSSEFHDVQDTDYFAPYVSWAKGAGITGGTSDSQFSPYDSVSREEMALFIVAFYREMGYEFPEQTVDTYPKDWDTVAGYAQDAVLTLWSCGMLAGDAQGNFNPQNPSNRAEVATFTYRVNEHLIDLGVKESVYATEEDSTEDAPSTGGNSSGGTGSSGVGGSSSSGSSSGSSTESPQENTGDKPLDSPESNLVNVSFHLGKEADTALVTVPQNGIYDKHTAISSLPQAEVSSNATLLSFEGWYYDENCKFSANSDVLSESTDLYAKVGNIQTANLRFACVNEENTSAVTFSNRTLYPTGTALSSIAPPELAPDYFFMGWFLDEVGEIPVDSQYLTEDTTVYAKLIHLSPGASSHFLTFAGGESVEENLLTLPSNGNYPQGYDLSLLPEPQVDAGIFLGWYQESACTTEVTGSLSSDMTVYALVQDLGPTAIYTPHFLSVEETGADYTFQIWGNSEEDIRQALTLLDATAENGEISYTLTAQGNGIYTVRISGYQEGAETVSTNVYEEGHIYKATLPESSGVCFVNSAGEVQDSSVRELNFSIAKANVQNLQLSRDLIYIPHSDVSNFTGNTDTGLMGIDVTNGAVSQTADAGVFTYTKETLSLGDMLAIYQGPHPSSRTVGDALTESSEDWILYATITDVGKDGNYAYVTPDSTEVLFTPDVLPISYTEDMDSTDGYVFTAWEDYFDYTDFDLDGDNLGLSGDTTVDVGDFLAFYEAETLELAVMARNTGDFARIDSVNVEKMDGVTCYVLGYTHVSEAEMMEAMDLHTEAVAQDMSLTEEEKLDLEQEIAQEALSSGFADMVAHSIGETLLDEDGYENLAMLTGLDQLEAHTTLKTLSVQSPEGYTLETLASVGLGVSATVKNITASAVVSVGYLSNLKSQGCSVELSIRFDYEIDCGNGLKVVLEVEAIFVQEVEFSVSVSGGAVWKWKWIIPYISDYRLNTSINVGTYTGIGLMGSIQLKEESNFLQDSFDFLQGKGNKTGAEKLSSIADTVGTLIDAGNFFELSDSEKSNLEEEYSGLLKSYSGDWVDVYTKNIVEQRGFVPGTLCVLAYGVDIDFVVAVRASVQLGMSFEYSNAKSYIFSISLFGKSATSQTIDRVTSNYMFNFYTIGTLGVRAGIRLTVRVGLLHVDLLSMGVQAEVGGYCQVWGYFYYRYAWESGKGSTSYKGGAFFLDMGLYLDINFCATAVGLNAAVPLYSNEWSLFTVGEYQVPLDFTRSAEEFGNLAYFGSKTLTLPSYAQEMYTQNLKTGDLGAEQIDWSDFTMKFSNPLFSWNKSSKKIIVDAASGQVEASSQLTLTYDNALDLHGPITRSFDIFWMDPDNANIYNFDSNGGSYIPVMTVGFSLPMTTPSSPSKTGYNFAGWYQDEALTQSYTFPSFSASHKEADVFLYAEWTPAPSPYTVEYYEQNLYGRYELVSSELVNENRSDWNILAEGSATHHSTTASSGFTHQPSLSYHSHDSIQGMGSLVVKEYFSRNEYSITFTAPVTGYAPLVYTYLYQYTAVIPNSLFYYAGYDFQGWYTTEISLEEDAETLVMPAQDMTFTATWVVGDSYYQVEHYLQQENGTYALGEMTQTLYDEETQETYDYSGNAVEYHAGKTGETVAELSSLQRQFFGYHYSKATGNGSSISGSMPSISGDNSTLIRLFYDRNMIEVHWNSDGGAEVDSSSVQEGREITLPPTPTKTGYVFVEWQDEDGRAFVPGTIIGTSPVTYKAIWSAGEGTEYKVKHIRQNIDGTYPDYGLLLEEQLFYGTTDSTVTPSVKSYDGFTSPTATCHSVFPDGSLVIVYEYSRNTYQIAYDVTGGNPLVSDITSYLYGEGTSTLPTPSKQGYVFSHWTLKGVQVPSISETELGDVTLVAVWEPDGNTAYSVEHYIETLSGGGYTLSRTTSHTGATEERVEAAQENIPGFSYDESNLGNLVFGEVLPDGSLCLKLYYSRNSYQVSWHNYDNNQELLVQSYQYEEVISAPNITPSRTGYTFGVWNNFAKVMGTSDLSYNGKDHGTWTANSYDILYDLQGGTLPDAAPKTYVYEVGTPLEAPTKAGYNFQYWTLSQSGQQVTEITTTDIGHISLVANWAVAGDTPYKVEHYSQNLDGSYTVHSSTEHTGQTEDSATASQIPITGFSYHSEHTDKVESDVIRGDGSTVLKLYYSRNQYTVHWYDYSNGSLESVPYLYEQEIVTTSLVPSRKGYTFDGWTGIAERMGTDNLEYSAKETANGSWTANSYSISYDTDGGTLPGDAITSYTYGIAVNLPNPTKTGYSFDSWTDGSSSFTALTDTDMEDKRLTAKWIAKSGIAYTVEHYIQDLGASSYSKEASKTQSLSGTTDTTVTGNSTSITGFTHNGEVVSGKIAGDGALVLKLYYTRNSYGVTWYDYNTSNKLGESSHEYQETIVAPSTLPKPSREGYTFDGWNLSSATMGTTAQTFNGKTHGKWTANSYTIEFHGNGGTGTMANLSMSYDTAKNLTANGFTRTGYTFAGWSTSAGGSVVYGAEVSVSNLTSTQNGTVTLYAVWMAISYTISYDMGGKGTVDTNFFDTSYTVESGTVTLPMDKINYITSSGYYRLTGWTSSSGTITKTGDNYVFTPSTSGGNVSLTAQWEKYYRITTNYTGELEPIITEADGGDTITISPTEGMYLTAVKVTYETSSTVIYTASRPTVDEFTFTMPSDSVVVTATQEVDRDATFNLDKFHDTVLNSATKVTFTREVPVGVSTTDISEDGNGGVLVWSTVDTEYFLGVANIGKTIIAPSTLNGFFYKFGYGYYDLISADLNALDTSNVTGLELAFAWCKSLTEVKFDQWDTSSLTTIYSTFRGCEKLTSLDLSSWDTSSMEYMGYFATQSEALVSVNLSGWDLSNVTNMRMMFYLAYSFASLNLTDCTYPSGTCDASNTFESTSPSLVITHNNYTEVSKLVSYNYFQGTLNPNR